MKKLFMVLAVVFALAAPMFAQTTFTDVPRDHWAYDAISELEDAGLIVGYPDGTFKGKNTMTRYEFAVILTRLLPYLEGGEGADVNGLVKKSELNKYMLKDDYKPGEEADTSGYATLADLNKIQALMDEFASELAALGVDVNVLKADVAALKSRVAALEDEQARVKINGTASFMVKSVISGDSGVPDYDGYIDTMKFARRKQSFYKDVQIDIKGRVNDKVNLYTTLVMSDLIAKDTGVINTWDTQTDIVPYYMYAKSSDEKWGDIRVGRMPFQINKFLFRKGTESAYFEIDRLDSHDYSVEGFDYSKAFGAFDVKVWGNRPVYDWNEGMLPYLNGKKISVQLGGQLGFNFGESGRITAVYDKMATSDRIPFLMDKPQYFGATAYVPFGQFYVDGGWFRMKPNKGLQKADQWKAALGFANDKLELEAGYKVVEDSYWAIATPDAIFDGSATNYKGVFANGTFNFTDAFKIYGDFRKYKSDNKALWSNFEDFRYYLAGIGYDVTPLDYVYAEYENGTYKYDAFPTAKTDVISVGWKRKVGENAKIKMMYQYLKRDPGAKSHIVMGQLTVNF
ncbi:MAG: S-layer homology domain-containing protein [Abditibacteriota bacterium]|nr:S-layer homology domain-containing protein [Abditibacteriota bacterium]